MTRVVTQPGEVASVLTTVAGQPSRAPRGRVLMVDPRHFHVEYAINPHMKDAAGRLNRVDTERARSQWEALRDAYTRLGIEVEVLPGHPELPDMVFAANQSLPFWNATMSSPRVILSRMHSDFRKPEVAHFRAWYQSRGYAVHELHDSGTLEGNGDALPDPDRPVVWGAVGPRTSESVYDEVARVSGMPVMCLRLVTEDYYHLDTCFALLGNQTVAIQPDAFDQRSVELIRSAFERVILLDQEESLLRFAGNCHSPDGKHVLLHPGATRFMKELRRLGYEPVEIDTSEFMKSGGSVFCMKMVTC